MLTFLFPGQGSQSIGMGKALYDNYACAKEVFDEVDEALGEKLSAVIFDGTDEQLTLTANTQPALMAVSLAATRVLEQQAGCKLSALGAYVAGHSLGEYSALCAIGALSVSQAARLLRLRGQAMQQAVPVGQGAMAAILGLEMEQVESLAQQASSAQSLCQVANDNAPGQIVLSGHKEAVMQAIDLAKEQGAKRALLLPVSAPFHCALMQPAADAMQEALQEVSWPEKLDLPLVANILAAPYQQGGQSQALLVEQVTGRVRWRESMQWLAQQGISETVELGAGKVLSGLMKRIAKDVKCSALSNEAEISAFLEARA